MNCATAEQILGGKADPGTRSKAKMVNYGIVYGLSGFGLADRLGIEREEADSFIAAYLERFPKVREFIDSTIAQATEDGYVTTLFGRRRRIPGSISSSLTPKTCLAVAVCTSSPRRKISLSTGSPATRASTLSSTCE